MAERKSRLFKIKKFELTTITDETFDIRDIVADFEYHESIDAAFIRCDFNIVDAVDFNKTLQGGETININIETASSDERPLKAELKVYKIGSIIKSERGQLYRLHTVSPEMYNNEIYKVFQAFGPGEGAKDEENVPKFICKKYLKAPRKKLKDENFENHSKITFISPSWRPVEAITYMSDKVTRINKSKGSAKQSGFLFYENRYGFQFKSIDMMCEGGGAPEAPIFEYSYQQQGSDPGNNGMFVIESVQYPDKGNHLQHMRMGTYKNISQGISLPSPTNNFATNSGKSGKNAPAGVIRGPRIITYKQIFAKASTIHKNLPFEEPVDMQGENVPPTRQKIRVLPGLKNQNNSQEDVPGQANQDGGSTPDIDTMAAAEYAAGRFSLLKAIQLTIVVPGNSALTAGQLLDVVIPASEQKGKRVIEDKRYSGRYLVAGVTHVFKREGLTSKVYLVRDSLKRYSY